MSKDAISYWEKFFFSIVSFSLRQKCVIMRIFTRFSKHGQHLMFSVPWDWISCRLTLSHIFIAFLVACLTKTCSDEDDLLAQNPPPLLPPPPVTFKNVNNSPAPPTKYPIGLNNLYSAGHSFLKAWTSLMEFSVDMSLSFLV